MGNIIVVPQKIIELYEKGDPIKKIYNEEEFIDSIASSTNLNLLTENNANASSTESLNEEINDILNP